MSQIRNSSLIFATGIYSKRGAVCRIVVYVVEYPNAKWVTQISKTVRGFGLKVSLTMLMSITYPCKTSSWSRYLPPSASFRFCPLK